MTIEEIQLAILKRAAKAPGPDGQPDTFGSLRNAIGEPEDRRLVSALELMCEDGRVVMTKHLSTPELGGPLKITYSPGMGTAMFLDRGDFHIAASPKGLAWLDKQLAPGVPAAPTHVGGMQPKGIASSFCRNCKRNTKHTVEHSHPYDHGPLPEDIAFLEDHWEILTCNGCGAPTFRRRYADENNYDPNIGEVVEDVDLFPPAGPEQRPVRFFRGASPELDRIFREATQAQNAGLRTLAAGGLRASLEALCGDKKVIDGPENATDPASRRSSKLQGKINGLAEKGHLTHAQAEHLHAIRFLGNDALHDLAEPQGDELRIAFDLVEETLESIYERDYRVAELRRHRVARKSVS